ncbi:hypothetical protein [Streptosporangium sp. CA-115845]
MLFVKEGRPSKALTLAQAEAVLKASGGSRMHASSWSLCSPEREPRSFGR